MEGTPGALLLDRLEKKNILALSGVACLHGNTYDDDNKTFQNAGLVPLCQNWRKRMSF